MRSVAPSFEVVAAPATPAGSVETPAPSAVAVALGEPVSVGALANPILERHPFLCGYAFFLPLLVLLFGTHLKAFTVSFFFLYLISDFLTNDVRRWVRLPKAILFSVLYVALLGLIFALAYKVIPDTLRIVPVLGERITSAAISQFEVANARWNLREYIDAGEVRSQIVEASKLAAGFVAGQLKSVYALLVYFLFAAVANLVLYHDAAKVDAVFAKRPASLMWFLYRFSLVRLTAFYTYLRRVMGGQFIISSVNTLISAIIIFGLKLPDPFALAGLVFVCGLFPIVGNLVSNAVLTGVALASDGPWAAAICLGLLVLIHKLEYFLNSHIIGEIVKLPMVVTLVALIVCEVTLGIVGLILAIPLVLFMRHELERVPGLRPDHPDTEALLTEGSV